MNMVSTSTAVVFDEVAATYPSEFWDLLSRNKSRLVWQIDVVRRYVEPGGSLLDVGAGVVPFMLVCQRLGYQTTVVDDLADDTVTSVGAATQDVVDLFRDANVRVIKGDVFEAGSIESVFDSRYNLITSHDSMEHWHNSPKSLFHRLWSCLEDDGLFWIGVPNCVNLRKRITVPLGYGKWSQMKDWYEPEVFRGHVREPDVGDLEYIARDLGASKVEILGRNWQGYRHPKKAIRTVTPVVDKLLQRRPALCSDINLLAWN